MTERYFSSVGRNTNLLLGMVIDNRGLVPDPDRQRFTEFGERITEINSRCLATTNGTQLELKLVQGAKVGMISLMEDIGQGERVRKFSVEAQWDGRWREIWRGTNIGHKQLERFDHPQPTELRLNILESVGTPLIREFSAWDIGHVPFPIPLDMACRSQLSIRRNRGGLATIKCDNPDLSIRYTLDGSDPDEKSPCYNAPFPWRDGGTVKAYAFINEHAHSTIAAATFGCDRRNWKVVRVSLESPYANGGFAGCHHLLDDDPETYWHTYHADKTLSLPPHEAVLEMDCERRIEALTLMPHAVGGKGIAAPDEYEFHLSLDGKQWACVAAGKFEDIKECPRMQTVRLDQPRPARFIRFVGKHAVDNSNYLVIAGIGAIAAKITNPKGHRS